MNLFLEINLLIGLSYFLFQSIEKIKSLFKVQTTYLASLRMAQIVLISSLFLAVLMRAIPHTHQMHSTQMAPTEEYIENQIKKTKEQSSLIINKAQVKMEQMNIDKEFDYASFLKVILGLGSLIVFFKFIINYFKLKSLLQNSVVIKKYKSVSIIATDEIAVPFSVRMLGCYWVVMPYSIYANKTDASLVLQHELQHHRQGDTIWALLIELLICIFYFNPFIYFWKNLIIELQEFSCDEALTGQKAISSYDYGSCLLRVAETALINREMYAGTTSMAVVFKNSKYFKTFLLRRIEMIMEKRKSNHKWISICTGLCVVLLTMTIAYGVEKISRNKLREVNSGQFIADKDIQKISDEALSKAISDTKSVAGFIIVADPMTGKILAVSNIDTKNNKKGHWALSELIEPASFVKTFVIAEALEKKATTPNEMHSCENGTYKFKGNVYHDWKIGGWDKLSTSQTLALSSDICSLKIAEKIGEKEIEKMFESFGFGEDGSVKDFPEARIGDRPESGEKYISRATLGYDFKSSPIEIIQAFGAIANGGNLMKPVMGDNVKPQVVRRVLDLESAKKMRELLKEVVVSGTGKKGATSNLYSTAGKTASARYNDYMKIDWYGGDNLANFAGFVGFAPVENPKVQVFVGLINPSTDKTGAHGSVHAAPVFKEVAENVLKFLKVNPDKTKI